MLKLVATDMDGTLLNDAKEMPKKTFEIIEELRKKGVMFVAASGRQYHSLLKLFETVKDDILIVAENGALILDKGEVIFKNVISQDHLQEIVAAVRQIPGTRINICGLESAYVFEKEMQDEIGENIKTYFPVVKMINTLDDLPASEQVIKLAIYDESHRAQETIWGGLKHLSHKYQIAVSGAEWVDIMNVGINKGKAIKKLQEKYAIEKEETMVFGDHMNDFEMMKEAYYSYAMANAIPEIKEVANFLAPSNEEQGVISILENFLAMTK